MSVVDLTPIEVNDHEIGIRQVGQWTLVWRRFRRHRLAMVSACVLLAVIVLAIAGPFISPPIPQIGPHGQYPPEALTGANKPPQLTWSGLMGTGPQGGPVLAFVLIGGRSMLAIAIFGALLSAILGVLIGSVAGYMGGVIDAILMRLVDAVLAIPFLLLLVLLTRYLSDHGLLMYVAMFGLAGWPGVTRLVRGYMLGLREREYAHAARALGVSSPAIVFRHLLPNALDVVIVSLTLNVALYLVTEATLDYLNAGVSDVTWGTLLFAGFSTMLEGTWWLWAFTGSMILITVLAVNFVGDGLRDALDATNPVSVSSRELKPGPVHRLATRTVLALRHVRQALPHLPAPRTLPQAPGFPRLHVPILHRLDERLRGIPVLTPPSLPLLLRLAPLFFAFVLVGTATLYAHSPLHYAPNFGVPVSYASMYGDTDYGAAPATDGGWHLFLVTANGFLTYLHVNANGGAITRHVLDRGDYSAQPSAAQGVGGVLGVWVEGSGSALRAAYVDRAPAQARTVAGGGSIEHPTVVAVPHGFDVIFTWQRRDGASHDLYLAAFRSGSLHPTLRRLNRAFSYDFYPRAIVDGTGALDVLYYDRYQLKEGGWRVLLRRFTPDGHALASPRPLGRFAYVLRRPSGEFVTDIIPDRWALALDRLPDGQVWAAWQDGVICTGCETPPTVVRMRAARIEGARPVLPPVVVDPFLDLQSTNVALAHRGNYEVLFYAVASDVQRYLQSLWIAPDGAIAGQQRVAYDAGGNASAMRAWTVRGVPRLLWTRVRSHDSILEGTSYRSYQGPDVLTHLGLNVGNTWGNLAVIIFGSLAGGVLLTVINLLLLVPLVIVWLLLRDFPKRMRWPIFLVAVTLLLAWIFALPGRGTQFVLVMPALGVPIAWLAVGGGVFVAGWVGTMMMFYRESSVRAAAAAVLALYFVATMSTAVLIQAQIGQI